MSLDAKFTAAPESDVTTEHLLLKLAEEASEVAQRALKAHVFGLRDKESGQVRDNRERLSAEVNDLLTIIQWLEERSALSPATPVTLANWMKIKRAKVARYFAYAASLASLEKGE